MNLYFFSKQQSIAKLSFFLTLNIFFPLFLFERKIVEGITKPKPFLETIKIFLLSLYKKQSTISSLSFNEKYAENGLPFCEPNIKSSPFNVYALPKLDKKINFSDFFPSTTRNSFSWKSAKLLKLLYPDRDFSRPFFNNTIDIGSVDFNSSLICSELILLNFSIEVFRLP